MSRVGPRLTIEASCMGCTHERSERYRVQGDSGHNVYCDHPKNAGAYIGDTRWDTPQWCPELAAAKARLMAKESGAT